MLEITDQVFSILAFNPGELKGSLPLYKMPESFMDKAFCNLTNLLPEFLVLRIYMISLDLTALYYTPLIYRLISLLAFKRVA